MAELNLEIITPENPIYKDQIESVTIPGTMGGFQILKDHALKNAMLPLVTIIAINLGFTVAGALQIETVFSWPGLGGAIFESVNRRDFPVLQGTFLLIAVSVILANLIADLTYSYLDPRVQSES